jgi:hypothetical protein
MQVGLRAEFCQGVCGSTKLAAWARCAIKQMDKKRDRPNSERPKSREETPKVGCDRQARLAAVAVQ